MKFDKVRTRIAPSPTGDPHVGTAYIALFNLAFAKKNGGDFLLRIEDTDQTRSTKESEVQIFESLKWLGLDYDEGPDVGGNFGPYRQSERFDLYGEYAQKLVDNGTAYHCFCTKDRLEKLREEQMANKQDLGYDGHCRNLSKEEVAEKLASGVESVVRLKMPTEGETIIKDVLRGEVKFDNHRIDDQVLLKADGFPTYHLANVVDDHLMEITHVIRAEEWISSTPKHLQLYRAFGWQEPEFVHMPLLRNADKSKISKRKNPTSLNYYRENGYLKEAMVNFLGLMGYFVGDDEVVSLDQFIETFDITKVKLGGPVFDLVKLGWLNNQHMRRKDINELTELTKPFFVEKGLISEELSEKEANTLVRVVDVLREGAQTMKEIAEKAPLYYNDELELEVVTEEMSGKERKGIERLYKAIENETGKASIKLFVEKMKDVAEDISEEDAKALLNDVLAEIGEGPGKVLLPLRIVVTGAGSGSDLYKVISIIGRDRTIARVEKMIAKYNI